MNKIFVTGANGFVGKNLIQELEKRHIPHIAGDRSYYGDITTQTNWGGLIKGCDCMVHLAARVHVMQENEADPLAAFRKLNVEAMMRLAKAAKDSGVKRFIYISSVKVNGEETGEVPFSPSDIPHPQDSYGISKMEAEIALMTLHEPAFFEVVIIRPPLIYGPGVKANFDRLFWLVKKKFPVPFGKVANKRSLVSVLNLSDLIIRCFDHPKAAGEIFLVSDARTYSLKDLIIVMGKVLGKKPLILPVPVTIMKCAFSFLGKTSYADRLFGNLHVNMEKTERLLDWHPPYSFEDTFKN